MPGISLVRTIVTYAFVVAMCMAGANKVRSYDRPSSSAIKNATVFIRFFPKAHLSNLHPTAFSKRRSPAPFPRAPRHTPQVTDRINPELHAELKEMMDAFAVHPFGFLGLDPVTFRLCVGYSEIVLALATLAPSRPHREWAYNMLGLIVNGAIFAHYSVNDGKAMTAQVMLMFIIYLRFYDFVAKFSAELSKAYDEGKAENQNAKTD